MELLISAVGTECWDGDWTQRLARESDSRKIISPGGTPWRFPRVLARVRDLELVDTGKCWPNNQDLAEGYVTQSRDRQGAAAMHPGFKLEGREVLGAASRAPAFRLFLHAFAGPTLAQQHQYPVWTGKVLLSELVIDCIALCRRLCGCCTSLCVQAKGEVERRLGPDDVVPPGVRDSSGPRVRSQRIPEWLVVIMFEHFTRERKVEGILTVTGLWIVDGKSQNTIGEVTLQANSIFGCRSRDSSNCLRLALGLVQSTLIEVICASL